MGHGGEGRGSAAEGVLKVGRIGGDGPDTHGVGGEAGLAMAQDGAEAAHQAAGEVSRGGGEEFGDSDTRLLGPEGEGFGENGEVLLQDADEAFVGIGEGARLGDGAAGFVVDRRRSGAGIGRRRHLNGTVGVGREVELDADLVELERGEQARGEGAALTVQDVHSAFEAENGIGRDGQGVPQIEGVVAAVVVGDAGVAIDDGGGFVQACFLNTRGDERAGVAEGFGIEDGGNLADERAIGGAGGAGGCAVRRRGEARENLHFGGAQFRGQRRPRPRDEGDGGLQGIEQALAEFIKRMGRGGTGGGREGRGKGGVHAESSSRISRIVRVRSHVLGHAWNMTRRYPAWGACGKPVRGSGAWFAMVRWPPAEDSWLHSSTITTNYERRTAVQG